MITFELPTVEIMSALISKLQMMVEQGHLVFKEMLAGHVPVEKIQERTTDILS